MAAWAELSQLGHLTIMERFRNVATPTQAPCHHQVKTQNQILWKIPPTTDRGFVLENQNPEFKHVI